MQNIKKIFECMKNLTDERKVLINCHEQSVKESVDFGDIDDHLKEEAVKSITSMKEGITTIQQTFDDMASCNNCETFKSCDSEFKDTEDNCFFSFKLDIERYTFFLDNYLKSEVFLGQIELFVERFIKAVYKELQSHYSAFIQSMPTLDNLLQNEDDDFNIHFGYPKK